MHQRVQLFSISILIVAALGVFFFATKAPIQFPTGSSFQVQEGESLGSISNRLEQEHFISWSIIFKAWVSMLGEGKKIGLRTYIFDRKVSMRLVISKLTKLPDEPLLSVAIPEGFTTEEIAESFHKAIPTISKERFVSLVQDEKLDGYLFPSTYYPLPSYDESMIIEKMKAQFDKEYTSHFGKAMYPKNVPTEQAIITLASILEGEAKTEVDMKIVSGVLQKRLAMGMRLQVDVAPVTYDKTGLPDVPIASPGIMALTAAFNPIVTNYTYYLTGKDGTMHYAKTFEEHKKNIAKYLR